MVTTLTRYPHEGSPNPIGSSAARIRLAARALILAALMLAWPGTAGASEPGPRSEPGSEAAGALFSRLAGDDARELCQQGWVEVDFTDPADGDFEGMEALVLFDMPPQQVLALLAQTGRQREYRPDLRSIESIEHTRVAAVDQHRMRVLFINVEYRVRYQFDYEHGQMTWRLEPGHGGSLEALEGFWVLYAFGDGRTLAHFGTHVRVTDALPSPVQQLATRSKLPSDLQHTRQWVNSNGRSRP
jgi:hypothetical protein